MPEVKHVPSSQPEKPIEAGRIHAAGTCRQAPQCEAAYGKEVKEDHAW